ncbi:MAG: Zn-ribbon domain-containing OB-fold protein [Firmicutes bacterium]|nr:Zn-ribbon domain-containing OB-fold protein [Bacillota bacterium]
MQFDMTKPLPVVQPWSKAFWEGTQKGKFLIQHCQDCNSNIFYPRKFCPECWSGNLDWIETSGKGTIFTFSTAMSMVEPRFMDELPYTLAYIDLDEGIRIMSRIVDCDPADIQIGMEVEVTFAKRDDFMLPYFRPVNK